MLKKQNGMILLSTWEYVRKESGMKERIVSVDIAIASLVSRPSTAKENVSGSRRQLDGDSHSIAIGEKGNI